VLEITLDLENQKFKHQKEINNNGIYTLGQSGTKPKILVQGNGTDMSDIQALRGRAKRKLITNKVVLALIDLANKKGDQIRLGSFWNTYHCQNKLISSEDRLYGVYCKNRFCTLCCSIRKAEIINTYLPILRKWEDPYFVTLTVKSPPLKHLTKMMAKVVEGFGQIIEKHKKRSQRNKGNKLVGIKSLECNFNPIKRTYNPHLHLIVQNEEMAKLIIEEWLIKWTPRFSNAKAQHMRKVENKERDLIEIVKYGSKIFTDPDIKYKPKSIKDHKVYISALYNIYCAMENHRIFDRFGFNLPKTEKSIIENSITLDEYQEWVFDDKATDWKNTDNELSLTQYHMPPNLIELLNYNMDIVLE